MRQRRIHAEHLVGRTVHDVDGCRVGRIEEIEVELHNGIWCVTDYVLGHRGLLKRLSFRGIAPLFFPALAKMDRNRADRVPWQKMDISNPKRPKLRCRKADL